MFTLDSTTLFYFDLSNDTLSSRLGVTDSDCQRQTVDEWARQVPQHSNPKSAAASVHSSSRGSNPTTAGSERSSATASKSSHIINYPNVNITSVNDGGLSDQDEMMGAEAALARSSPPKNGKRVTREVGHSESLKGYTS